MNRYVGPVVPVTKEEKAVTAADKVTTETKKIEIATIQRISAVSADVGAVASGLPGALSKSATAVSAAASVVHGVGRVAAVATGVAAAVASLNPVVLPAVATCALIIALTLRQKGLHSKLLKVMSDNTEEMVEIVTYTKFAEYIYGLMVNADPSLKDHDIDRLGVEKAADKLRTNLIIYASPDIFKELRAQKAVTNANLAKIDATRYTKLEGTFGRFFSQMSRVISPSSISEILDDNLQDLFNACGRMSKKFLLFTQINHATFDRVIGGIKNTSYYNALFKVAAGNETPLLSDTATPEEIAAYMETYCGRALEAPLNTVAAAVDLEKTSNIIESLVNIPDVAIQAKEEVLDNAVEDLAAATGIPEAEAQANLFKNLSKEEKNKWEDFMKDEGDKNVTAENIAGAFNFPKGGRRRRHTRGHRQNRKRRQSHRKLRK
jgi:hypothetical protein